jgi:hypothetical protein
MPKLKTITWNGLSEDELSELYKKEKDGRLKERYHTILLKMKCLSVQQKVYIYS